MIIKEDLKALRRKKVFPFLLLSPFAILALIFVVVPIILMIVISFTDMDFMLRWNFIGGANFKKMFGYPQLKAIVLRTLLFVAADVTLSVFASIFVCIITTYYLDIVYKRKQMGLFYRVIWLIPSLTPNIVYVFIWRFAFGARGYGWINNMLAFLKMDTVDWFSKYAMVLLLFITVLKSASGSIILFSSAIRQIPNSIYQSAKVDGAGNLNICFKIVMPYLKWPITQKTLYSILGNFCAYETIRLFTNGGPMGGTTTYAYYIYQNAYKFFKYGYGAALSVFLVAMSLFFGMIMLKVFNVDKQLRDPRLDI